MGEDMRRREFITFTAMTVAALPVAAQGSQQKRRIGLLLAIAEGDKTGRSWVSAFTDSLQKLGWSEGNNIDLDYRFTGGDPDKMQEFAIQLAKLRPDAVLVAGTAVVAIAKPILRDIPVVFVQVTDPVGTGFVKSLAHPGVNMTGFTSFEYSFGSKWVELLHDLHPGLTTIAVLEHADNANRKGYLRTIQTAASALTVKVDAPDVRSEADIARAFADFGQRGDSALIVPPDPFTLVQRGTITALAKQHKLPAVYAFPPFVADGGLMSYGVDNNDMYRRAASYVDRILHGEHAADLPVQASNKFLLMVNLKAAKAIGLDIPPGFLVRADEVIE
jgi:putative tryptophan/tyrosine transport system substrate-binding protein